MDLTHVITRLKGSVTGMRSIGGSADMDAALRGTLVCPAIFVVPLVERPSDEESDGSCGVLGLTQLFGVLFVVENFRDVTGEASLVDLAGARRQVRKALVGWVPDPRTGEPVKFRLGELVQCEGDGKLWWSDEFTAKFYDHF